MIMCMKMCLHDSTDYTGDSNLGLGSCGHLGGQRVNKTKQVVRASTALPSSQSEGRLYEAL